MALNFATNNSLSAITALPSDVSGGALNLISTTTASSSATINITSGIDSTYKEYIFKFYNMHPATNGGEFGIGFSIDGGSNYNASKTTTFFWISHDEASNDPTFEYRAGQDLANATGFQHIGSSIKGDADAGASGTLHLFDPSNTTFVKHFISDVNSMYSSPASVRAMVRGYVNSTSAVNAVSFKMANGNTDSGVIKLYGVS